MAIVDIYNESYEQFHHDAKTFDEGQHIPLVGSGETPTETLVPKGNWYDVRTNIGRFILHAPGEWYVDAKLIDDLKNPIGARIEGVDTSQRPSMQEVLGLGELQLSSLVIAAIPAYLAAHYDSIGQHNHGTLYMGHTDTPQE